MTKFQELLAAKAAEIRDVQDKSREEVVNAIIDEIQRCAMEAVEAGALILRVNYLADNLHVVLHGYVEKYGNLQSVYEKLYPAEYQLKADLEKALEGIGFKKPSGWAVYHEMRIEV